MDGTILLVGGGALALVTVVVAGKAIFGGRASTPQSAANVNVKAASATGDAPKSEAAPVAAAVGPAASTASTSPLPPPTPKTQSIRPEIPSSHPEPSRPPSTPPPPAAIPRPVSVRPLSTSPPSSSPPSLSPTSGMSADDLRAMIGGREADLTNIEVYYRLGVALQGGSSWDEAMHAFATVEEVSPGYRDAQKRLEEIVRATGGTPELPPSQRTDMPPPMRAQQRTMMGVAPSVVLGPSPPRDLPLPSPPPPPAKSDSE